VRHVDVILSFQNAATTQTISAGGTSIIIVVVVVVVMVLVFIFFYISLPTSDDNQYTVPYLGQSSGPNGSRRPYDTPSWSELYVSRSMCILVYSTVNRYITLYLV